MAWLFINQTDVIGQVLESGTRTMTGSVIATLLFILLFIIVLAFMFGIPLEFLVVIILPFCIGVSAYYATFFIPLTIICIFIASILAKNWLFK